jgi:hypothetical protein
MSDLERVLQYLAGILRRLDRRDPPVPEPAPIPADRAPVRPPEEQRAS